MLLPDAIRTDRGLVRHIYDSELDHQRLEACLAMAITQIIADLSSIRP